MIWISTNISKIAFVSRKKWHTTSENVYVMIENIKTSINKKSYKADSIIKGKALIFWVLNNFVNSFSENGYINSATR